MPAGCGEEWIVVPQLEGVDLKLGTRLVRRVVEVSTAAPVAGSIRRGVASRLHTGLKALRETGEIAMGRLVNVHYMDKEVFLTNNADGDEEPIVFYTSPSYDELVAKVRHVLKWMDLNDGVKLIGRKLTNQKTTLELFATKVEPPRVEIDLNRLVSSPMTERKSVPFVEQRIMIDASNAYSQAPTSKEIEVELHAPNACSPPPTSQANEVDVIASEKVIQKDGDGDIDGDFDEVEEGFHGIDVGDLDAHIAQKEMDRELPFRRLYGYDSDDEGPHEGGKPNSL
ncbi:Sensor protein gacS [Hordeum vulgare]|nr:Sensor protein gacS [Hordeum vulgare]